MTTTELDNRGLAGVVLGALVGLSLAVAGFIAGVGASGLAGETTSFWYLSRAAGLVAYALLWGSVVCGSSPWRLGAAPRSPHGCRGAAARGWARCASCSRRPRTVTA